MLLEMDSIIIMRLFMSCRVLSSGKVSQAYMFIERFPWLRSKLFEYTMLGAAQTQGEHGRKVEQPLMNYMELGSH